MKIELFFPPGWGIGRSPHLGLPMLTGYLRSHGAHVSQRDLNCEFSHRVLSEDFVALLEQKLRKQATQRARHPNNKAKDHKKNVLIAQKLLSIIPQQLRTLEKEEKAAGFERAILYYYPKRVFLLKHLSFILSTAYQPNAINLDYDFIPPAYQPSFLHGVSDYTLGNFYYHSLRKDNNIFFDAYRLIFGEKEDCAETRLIGISFCRNFQLTALLTLARFMKQRYRNAFIVVGGAMVPYIRDALFNFPKIFDIVDCFIEGEGEIPLLKLIEALKQKKGRLIDIPGALLRHNKKKVVKNDREALLEPEDFPTPDFSDYDLSKYFLPTPLLPFASSRGCYWNKCAFCTLSSSYGKYRELPMTQVAQQLRILTAKHGCRIFYFVDECIPPLRLQAIAAMIKKEGLQLSWNVEARFEEGFTKQILKQAHRQGCRWISWGLESGCDRVLRLMHKGTHARLASKILRTSHGSGMWNNVYVMLGFPQETRKQRDVTLDFIKINKGFIDTINVGEFHLERHSVVYNQPEKFGITIDKVPLDYCEFSYLFKRRNNDSRLSDWHRNQIYKLFFSSLAQWEQITILLAMKNKDEVKVSLNNLWREITKWKRLQ